MALSDRPFGPTSRGTAVPPIALNEQATSLPAATGSPLPVTQVLTGTAETLVLVGPLPQVPLLCQVPPATALEQTVFDFWASGYLETTASGNVTLKVYEGTSATVGSNTLLGSSGTVAQATTTAPFWIHMRLIYDSVSGLLCGDVEFYVNKTKVASVTLSNFVTGVDNLVDPVASFCITLTSSGAGSGTPTTINVQKFTCG